MENSQNTNTMSDSNKLSLQFHPQELTFTQGTRLLRIKIKIAKLSH